MPVPLVFKWGSYRYRYWSRTWDCSRNHGRSGSSVEKEVIQMPNESCFLAACPCIDTIVHLGPAVMGAKDLDKEMAEGTPFGLKLRAIAKKVEALM